MGEHEEVPAWFIFGMGLFVGVIIVVVMLMLSL